MRNAISLLILLTIVTACATAASIEREFQEISQSYSKMLRWREFDKLSLFTRESLRKQFEARVKAAKHVMIVDYRVLDTEYNSENGEAVVDVEIDYYIPPSNRIKTVLDSQKWIYGTVKGQKQWRLATLLPEFK